MVHKSDNSDSAQRDKFTHRALHIKPYDLPDGDVGYELAWKTDTMEIVRISNWLVGVSASGYFMIEFSKWFSA